MAPPALDNIVGLDCEMITTSGQGFNFEKIVLARVAIVDHQGKTLYDSFVHVSPKIVKDYCTSSSGVTAEDLLHAPKFEDVQAKVREVIRGKTVVGHALFNDLAALQIRLPLERTRDTALYYPLRQKHAIKREGEYPALRILARDELGLEIQAKGQGGHDPSVDSSTAVSIYLKYRDDWEKALVEKRDVTSCIPSHYADWYF